MATNYSGRNAVVGFGEESTWGTSVSRTNWLPLISTTMQRNLTKTERPTLRVGSAGAMRRAHFTSEDVVGGSIVVEASYSSMGILCKHLLGGLATTGSGPYTHTYTLGAIPTGLSVEIGRGTGTGELFSGCRVESATFDVSAGGVMQLTTNFIGKTAAARGTLPTATISTTDLPVLHNQPGTLAYGGNTFTLNSMSLTVSTGIARRQRLGAATTSKPLISDFQSVELAISLEIDDQLLTDHLDDTEGDAVITFTSGTNSVEFTIQNAYVSAATDPISDAGIVTQSCTLMGQSDGTDEGIKIAITNDNASGTAN